MLKGKINNNCTFANDSKLKIFNVLNNRIYFSAIKNNNNNNCMCNRIIIIISYSVRSLFGNTCVRKQILVFL